jgi:hypothetical protein
VTMFVLGFVAALALVVVAGMVIAVRDTCE